ncbi:MAG: D-Ala-D-Ala carboxypeptidase family metallohydrolase [Cyanobacteria bacterium J06627_8]
MPKLTATQRNYLYLIETSRTGIHKPILAALYAVHETPILADGEFGLGLSRSPFVEVTQLDTFIEQVQFGANTVRSLADQLLFDGATGNDIWDASRGHYSDRFLRAIATGYTPPNTNPIAATLAESDFSALKGAYLTDIDTRFDGSQVAQNLAFLDRPLIELTQRIPTYYNGSNLHRTAGLETIRLWRSLNTQTEAIQSLFSDPLSSDPLLNPLPSNDDIDAAIINFFQNSSPFYGGLPHQREALLRLTQLWRQLDTREAAIASLRSAMETDADLSMLDPALLLFAKNVSLFFQSKLDQRLAVLEAIRLWRSLDSRQTVLEQLGIDPRVFEQDALSPDIQLQMLRTLDRALVQFTQQVPAAYQATSQQREALIRMFQVWRRLRTREETLQALFSELANIPAPVAEPEIPVTDQEVRLSRNFTLREMTRSTTADRLGLDNTPSPAEIENLRKLCQQILQPARDALGPLTVTSGFRSDQVNRRVGGVPMSDHRLGYAADIIPVSVGTRRFADWVRDNVAFDQVILEGGSLQNPRWIHVSANPRNRRQFFHVPNP